MEQHDFEALKIWKKAKEALEAIPESWRSRYHTNYLNELEMRVSYCEEIEEFKLKSDLNKIEVEFTIQEDPSKKPFLTQQ